MSTPNAKPVSAAYLRISIDWDNLEHAIRQIGRGTDFLGEMEAEIRRMGHDAEAGQLAFLHGFDL
jgi:hypothetical protein